MKKNEAQERRKTPEAPGPPGAPAAGRTQELSREETLAYLEKTKQERPEPEPRRPGKPPVRRG
jgi:hypothetical protein